MGHVLISPEFHSHSAIRKMPSRAVFSWVASVCWLSRHDRQVWFPAELARSEFYATPRVIEALCEQRLWLRNQDAFLVPQKVPSWGGRDVVLWKYPPANPGRPTIPARLRIAVYERDGYACLHCGTSDDLTLDHIHPWSRGGPDTYDNLQTLCRSCNSRKGARV